MKAGGRTRASSWWAAGPDAGEDHRRVLVGRDFRDTHATGRFRLVAALLVVALVGGLLVAALRVDLIRMRYAMAEVMEQEQAVFAEHRQLTVEVQQRRDPARIAARARALGFVRPERILDLAVPTDVPTEQGETESRP